MTVKKTNIKLALVHALNAQINHIIQMKKVNVCAFLIISKIRLENAKNVAKKVTIPYALTKHII